MTGLSFKKQNKKQIKKKQGSHLLQAIEGSEGWNRVSLHHHVAVGQQL